MISQKHDPTGEVNSNALNANSNAHLVADEPRPTKDYLEALEIEIKWGRHAVGIEFVNQGAPIEINGTLSAVKTVGSLVFGQILNAGTNVFRKRFSNLHLPNIF